MCKVTRYIIQCKEGWQNAGKICFLALVFSGFTACVSQPTDKLQKLIKKEGLLNVTIPVSEFDLSAATTENVGADLIERFVQTTPSSVPSETNSVEVKTLHVYLEGDGRPWTNEHTIAANPTSQSLLALKLMLQDTHPSLYLNRPCYGLVNMPDNCSENLWTDGRYSEQVVRALNEALDIIKKETGFSRFTLIGHSGGGSLAIVLAARRDDIVKLITITPNIDHQKWTDHFNYIPLKNSINPIDQLPAISDIDQWHLYGENDQIIPKVLVEDIYETEKIGIYSKAHLQKQAKKVKIISFPSYDHHCCWEKGWREILMLTDVK